MTSWEVRPLHKLVYSIIQKKKSISYDLLVKEVKNYSNDISENELRNTLIKLEIWGKIDVISINEKHLKVILKEN